MKDKQTKQKKKAKKAKAASCPLGRRIKQEETDTATRRKNGGIISIIHLFIVAAAL
jgi:hypothetical protein